MPPCSLQGVWSDVNFYITVDHYSSLIIKDLSKDGICGGREFFDMNALDVLIFPEGACPTYSLVLTQPACQVFLLELHIERPIAPRQCERCFILGEVTCNVCRLSCRGQSLSRIMIAIFVGLQRNQAWIGKAQEPESPIFISQLLSQECPVLI